MYMESSLVIGCDHHCAAFASSPFLSGGLNGFALRYAPSVASGSTGGYRTGKVGG
jgi:hypothetical protein